MSCDWYHPHVHVLPEDDANSALAYGFQLGLPDTRKLQVLEAAGGRDMVRGIFRSIHVPQMKRNPNRFMVLLIDFDDTEAWLPKAKNDIPEDLVDRVFIIGVLTKPEDLKLGPFETVGKALAKDCRDESYETWQHELLRHNAEELERLRRLVRPILFPADIITL